MTELLTQADAESLKHWTLYETTSRFSQRPSREMGRGDLPQTSAHLFNIEGLRDEVVLDEDDLAPRGEQHDPIIVRSESPPFRGIPLEAMGPAAVNHAEATDFLLIFLNRIRLKELYGPLKGIGVDEAGLHRMSRYDEERLDTFIVKLGKLVPRMTPFMCLTLSEEIRRLAEMPIDLD
ncbi:hypothetical protein B0H19DRAFT_1271876 [Mycena capillaripes]|nr:hypothetical protein B0H19DRAFT_1271876 [Mycena capillaripes]